MNSNPKLLIVEGEDDKFSVVGLMEHHVLWPAQRDDWPVLIQVGGGCEEILKKGYLTVQLKASRTQVVGIMLDADTRPVARYTKIRELCSDLFQGFPEQMPPNGLIIDNEDNIRLGVWVMPDNKSEGSLETFLRYLVPDGAHPVWRHAVASTETARGLGAPYHDPHVSKAELYSWLAWQNPPGYSPGRALTQKVLDPHSPSAAPFVKWFLDLYQLEPIR